MDSLAFYARESANREREICCNVLAERDNFRLASIFIFFFLNNFLPALLCSVRRFLRARFVSCFSVFTNHERR